MKKTLALTIVIIMLTSMIPLATAAATSRTPFIYPTLTFSGTTATCGLAVSAEKTDRITATVTLYNGSSVIARWMPSAVGSLAFVDTATVSKNATYTLTAQVYINSVAQVPASTTRTNN